MPPIHGSCLCGGVEFEIAGPLTAPLNCRCPKDAALRGRSPPPLAWHRCAVYSGNGNPAGKMGSAMAKKTRKKTAAKAPKKPKTSTKKKSAATKTKKTKKQRKAAAKLVAPKKFKPVAKKKPADTTVSKPPPQSFVQKVENVFTGVVDTLTDAERLVRKLDPGDSREPE
jgi:hypothetical protein